MAEGQMMTAAEVVAQIRDGRLEDFVRQAVVLVVRELMEAEISAEIGAELGEVAPKARVTHRSGYRARRWETRVGEIELLIPRKRQGSYFPSFLAPRRRSDQAIVAVVLGAYMNGVSTRKVDRLVEQLGIEGMTKDRVSEICRGLDEQVELFRSRPLDVPVRVVARQAGQGQRSRPSAVRGVGGRLPHDTRASRRTDSTSLRTTDVELPSEATIARTPSESTGDPGRLVAYDGEPKRTRPDVPRRLLADISLAALFLVGVLAERGLLGPARPVAVLLAATIVPGGALMIWVPADDTLTNAGLSVAVSLSIWIIGALVCVWTALWDPVILALVVAVVALLSIAAHIGWLGSRMWVPPVGGDARSAVAIPAVRFNRTSLTWLVHLLPLVVGVAAWAVALPSLHTAGLGQFGLLPLFPVAWYAALASLLAGAIWSMWITRRPHGWVMAAYVGGFVLVLFGTVPSIDPVPWFAWIYKHMGVVLHIEQHHSVNPHGDIYNRWPGFFAASAVYSQLSDLHNPIAYAGWAQPVFKLWGTVLVGAIALTVTRDKRVAGAASLVAVITDWVGQTTFAPQAMGTVLALAILLVVIRTMCTDEPRGWLLRGARSVVRIAQLPFVPPSPIRWPPKLAVAVALTLDFALVATHELTPYILLILIAGLMLLGVLRRPWLLIAMAAITFGYLAPNLVWVLHNYSTFASVDPAHNLQATQYPSSPTEGTVLSTNAQLALTFLLWTTAAASLVWLCRRGRAHKALLLGFIAFLPFTVLLGTNYGGEAILRVVIFSIPGAAALIAAATALVNARLIRVLGFGALVTAMVALFVPAFLGSVETTVVSPAEVAAAEYFYAHARHGTVLVMLSIGFPLDFGSNYDTFRPARRDLVDVPAIRSQHLASRDVPLVIREILASAPAGYVAFTTTDEQFASQHGQMTSRQEAALQDAIAHSPRFRLWYANRDAQIYQLVS